MYIARVSACVTREATIAYWRVTLQFLAGGPYDASASALCRLRLPTPARVQCVGPYVFRVLLCMCVYGLAKHTHIHTHWGTHTHTHTCTVFSDAVYSRFRLRKRCAAFRHDVLTMTRSKIAPVTASFIMPAATAHQQSPGPHPWARSATVSSNCTACSILAPCLRVPVHWIIWLWSKRHALRESKVYQANIRHAWDL